MISPLKNLKELNTINISISWDKAGKSVHLYGFGIHNHRLSSCSGSFSWDNAFFHFLQPNSIRDCYQFHSFLWMQSGSLADDASRSVYRFNKIYALTLSLKPWNFEWSRTWYQNVHSIFLFPNISNKLLQQREGAFGSGIKHLVRELKTKPSRREGFWTKLEESVILMN